MRKRFDYKTEELTDELSSNGVSLKDPTAEYADELYDRVGERFPVIWESKSRAEPIINVDRLPDHVSQTDIEQALTDMKDSGIL